MLKEGDYFGEIAFFTRIPRLASAKVLDFAEMLYIDRNIIKDFVSKFPRVENYFK